MNKLKTQLLMLGRDRGDTGTNEEQRQLIEVFFQVMAVYFTPAAIQSFTLDQLRAAYIYFGKICVEVHSLEAIMVDFGQLIHIRDIPRTKPVLAQKSSDNIVDIFSLKA